MMAARRFVAPILAMMIAASAAEADAPLVEVEVDETSAIPGQFLTLRINVLVPTWLPEPAVFPSLEAPNIFVQLPDRATGPMSRIIEGETWSGVTRRYLIAPMVPGQFQIPEQQIEVTWADPGQPEPQKDTVPIGPFTIEGILPAGTEDLDPFLAAKAVTLTAEQTDAPQPMKLGDSITLTVTAEIEGTSAMFLPPLLPQIAIDGIAAYPAEPVIADKEDRGILSGTRRESVTLIAEAGGGGAFPALAIAWYDLDGGTVETASIPGFDLTVDAPPPAAPPMAAGRAALLAVSSLAVAVLIALAIRRAVPPLRRLWAKRLAARAATERHAFRRLKEAVAARDFRLAVQRLDIWAQRCVRDPRQSAPLSAGLCALGAVRYGGGKGSDSDAWRMLNAALAPARKMALATPDAQDGLPPLNPGADPRSFAKETP